MEILADYTTLATTADNCDANPVVTQFPLSGDTINSDTTVWLYSTDASGNVDSCSFMVMLSDTTSPAISCSGNQANFIDDNCNFTIPDYTTLATTSDNCATTIVVTQSPVIGTVASIGTTVITLTANDGSGNTSNCTFNLVLLDTILPSITCPSNQNVVFDASCGFTLPDYSNLATATDNCVTPIITQTPVAGTVITTTTSITLTADDGSGNTAACSFSVIPTDVDIPFLLCPDDETLFLDANCSVTVPDYSNIASISDNCDASPTVVQTPALGTVYVGEQIVNVSLLVTDAAGNADSCDFFITLAANAASGCLGQVVSNDLFSPNGDGKNDMWVINNQSYIQECTISVYSRSGQKVFEATNYQNDWDGTFNGGPLPEGTYYYLILCDGQAIEKGDITILR